MVGAGAVELVDGLREPVGVLALLVKGGLCLSDGELVSGGVEGNRR
jgi:hypothetical protein